MSYDEWEAAVPAFVKGDVIWHVQAYRLALFIADVVERDTRPLMHDKRFADNLTQVVRAAGSIGATISEGYPRQSAKDRIRYYEYALGSAGEVKTWYFNSRAAISDDVIEQRYAVLTSITRLLHTMIRTAGSATVSRTRLSRNR
jgi:four helix bundle protein